MFFNTTEITETSNKLTADLLSRLKVKSIDQTFTAQVNNDVELNVYITEGQVNFALTSPRLHEWLLTFYKLSEDELSPFELNFFSTLKENLQDNPLFIELDQYPTQVWINDEREGAIANAVMYSSICIDTDLESPDYALLEKVLLAGYIVLVMGYLYLNTQHVAETNQFSAMASSSTIGEQPIRWS